jgi:hypothetical protein
LVIADALRCLRHCCTRSAYHKLCRGRCVATPTSYISCPLALEAQLGPTMMSSESDLVLATFWLYIALLLLGLVGILAVLLTVIFSPAVTRGAVWTSLYASGAFCVSVAD